MSRYTDIVTPVLPFELAQAVREVRESYGDIISIQSKAKSLIKFGRTVNADSGVRTTVAIFQGAVVNETFVSTNLIDSIASSNAGDTQTIAVEGHVIDTSGNLTFSAQTVTLNGQTEVPLNPVLARANRAYVPNSGVFDSPQAALLGTVSVYDNTGGQTGGVPTVPAATKLIIEAGKTQSEKCATSISATDYWIITSAHVGVTESGPAAAADFDIEIRDVANGGVWRPLPTELEADSASQPTDESFFTPCLIVPKNHDVRMIVTSDTANTEVSGDIRGYLAHVVGTV